MGLLTLKFTTDVRDQDYEAVEFHGEMDQSTISNTEKQISEFLAGYKRKYLIFDFTDLKYTNSDGIGFVMSTNMNLGGKGQKLIVCGCRPNVAEVVELMGLPQMLPVLKTMSDAIEFIKKNK